MGGVYEVKHPLIDCHLSRMRDASTGSEQFRSLVRRVATLLAYEATKDLSTEATEVTTPLTKTAGSRLAERIGLIPILRAGLGMVEPVLDLIPSAEVWHLGLYRDEATAEPVEYYSKLPPGRPVDTALIVDPMLATGGSVMAAVDTLTEWGVQRIKVLAVIASQEGINLFAERYPDVQIFVCRIDPDLNANKFIVPGLGDAGDRVFNAKAH